MGTVDFPPAWRQTITESAPYTLTSDERVGALCASVEYIVRYDVPGAFVECGVWKGGSLIAMLSALRRERAQGRQVFGFDTFTGMPDADEVDVDYRGGGLKAGDLSVSEQAVLEAIQGQGYATNDVHLVRGLVEDTIPAEAPETISLLRLDTDFYASTAHELEHLYPRLVTGGVLLIDDYGHFGGCREAVDEYFADRPVLLHRIDYTGRVAVKTA